MLKYLQAEAIYLSAASAATNTDRSRMPRPAHFKTRSKVQSLIILFGGSGGDGLRHARVSLFTFNYKGKLIYAMFHFVTDKELK